MVQPQSPDPLARRADTGHGRRRKEDVVKIVRALRDQGIAIVVFSTEPKTVLSLADRVLVMRKGEIAHEFAGEAISKGRLLAAA